MLILPLCRFFIFLRYLAKWSLPIHSLLFWRNCEMKISMQPETKISSKITYSFRCFVVFVSFCFQIFWSYFPTMVVQNKAYTRFRREPHEAFHPFKTSLEWFLLSIPLVQHLIITSLLRKNGATALFWRYNDVIIASCVHCDFFIYRRLINFLQHSAYINL